MKITILGLGTCPEDLTLQALEILTNASNIILRTQKHSTAKGILQRGIQCQFLDQLYEKCETFDDLQEAIVKAVVTPAVDCIYAVPGSGAVGDATVRAVVAACIAKGISYQIVPGIGWETKAAALAGGVASAMIVPASAWEDTIPDPRQPLIITEMDSREMAGEIKLCLLDHYPSACQAMWCGQPIPLYALDRQEFYDHTCTLVMLPVPLEALESYDMHHLLEIVGLLRDPWQGCPWDLQQTHESLRAYLIEEAYEVLDAMQSGDPMRLADELGDLLLQVVLHAQIAKEHTEFTMLDITTAVCSKMISRHRHIFGSATAHTAEDVLLLWDQVKKEEKQLLSLYDTLCDVPRNLPAAMRAQKVLKKAVQQDREIDLLQALAKVHDLSAFMHWEIAPQDADYYTQVGDLLLHCIDVARLAMVPAELSLSHATDRLIDALKC